MQEIDINEFYMSINTNQRMVYIIMLFKIQKCKKDEPQFQFSQLNQQLFTLLYLHFLQSYITNILKAVTYCYLFNESYT